MPQEKESASPIASPYFRAAEFVNSFEIPIQMTIANNVYKEIKKANPDIRIIVNETSKDVGLSASVLKLSNSPIFGGAGVRSIEHALNVVGFTNFLNVVVSSIFQHTFSALLNKAMLGQFWQHSMLVARSMSFIARKMKNSGPAGTSGERAEIDENDAYLTGLFHDCAIPLFIMKFPNYADIFDLALSNDDSINKIENETYKTNHAIGGYLLTKSWKLPDCVSDVILHHHNKDIRVQTNAVNRRLAATHRLSECMSYYYGSLTHCIPKGELPFRMDIMPQNTSYESLFENAGEWEQVFQELKFDEDDIEDLQNDIYEMISIL